MDELCDLKEEVLTINLELQESRNSKNSLKRRLRFFGERYEREIINDSVEMGEENDRQACYEKYYKYALRTFSKNYSFTQKKPRNNRNPDRRSYISVICLCKYLYFFGTIILLMHYFFITCNCSLLIVCYQILLILYLCWIFR